MSKAEQEESRAFHRGVEAMRDHIAKGFEVYGPNQKWTGPQFAHMVRNTIKAPDRVSRETPDALPSPLPS